MRAYIKKRPRLKKVIKFGTSGVICIIADFVIVFILFQIIGINQYISNIISTIISLILNYILNRNWTFRSNSPWRKEFVKFVSFASIGLVLNNLIVFFSASKMERLMHYICNVVQKEIICVHAISLGFYGSKIIAIGIVFFWNFFINSNFNFKEF